jgi:hypothetical protein
MKQNTYQDYENVYPNSEENDCLFNWIFHYNPISKVWNAIPRDKYNDYWNNINCDDIIKSTQISTLVDLIIKMNNSNLDLNSL